MKGDRILSTILLVDSDYIVRPVLARMLADEGHHVLEAKSAEQALEVLAEVSVDLIITAFGLSRANGDQLSSARATGHKMPVILMKDYPGDVVDEGAYSAVFFKPLVFVRIHMAVERALSQFAEAG